MRKTGLLKKVGIVVAVLVVLAVVAGGGKRGEGSAKKAEAPTAEQTQQTAEARQPETTQVPAEKASA